MPKISLSGPADLLTILPYHLGFQPTRSVVVACFHGKRLGLVARFDLPPGHLAEASAAAGLPTLVRDRPSSVCLVGFEAQAGESHALIDALRAGLVGEGVRVQDRLVVRDGRWFSVDCDCCPPGGRPMPEPADVPGVAGYIALGHSVLDDRDSLAGLVRPLEADDPRHADVEAAVDTWQARYTVMVALDRLRTRGLLADGGADETEGFGELAELVELADQLVELADEREAKLGPSGDDGDVDLHDDTDLREGDEGATVIDLETGRRRRAASPSDGAGDDVLGVDHDGPDADRTEGAEDTDLDDFDDFDDFDDLEDCDSCDSCDECRGDVDLEASVVLQAESLAAWSAVLRGEISGDALVERVPALVGPLRDVVFRDALIAWLCPGAVPLSEFPAALVALLEAFVGADVRAAAAAESAPPQPRPRRGRRKRGRRLDRHLGRRPDTRVEGGIDGHGATWEDWRAWEEASAPHLVQARLESVCRAVPAAHAAPLLALVGNYAWWRGDGARAGVALDAALDLEPDHRLAGLIREALDRGLRGGGAGSPQDDRGAAPYSSGSWNRPSSA
jgi:hypothetical protein